MTIKMFRFPCDYCDYEAVRNDKLREHRSGNYEITHTFAYHFFNLVLTSRSEHSKAYYSLKDTSQRSKMKLSKCIFQKLESPSPSTVALYAKEVWIGKV